MDVSLPGSLGPANDPAVLTLPPVSPADELGVLVSWAASIFYLAESEVNPGVKDYWDALHYVATSLSVGYANIFPMTAIGKTVGSVLMMVGPALSARVLDGNRAVAPVPAAPEHGAVVERLDAILQELQRSKTS